MEYSENSKPELEPAVEDEEEINRGFLMFIAEVSQIHPDDLENYFTTALTTLIVWSCALNKISSNSGFQNQVPLYNV